MDGELEPVDGGWRLVFRRRLPHPPERVWRALTGAEHLAAWFPQRIEGEWLPGATLRFVSGEDDADAFTGEVLAVDTHRLLEFTWGTDRLRFELAPDGTGTLLTLFDTFAEQGRAARDAAGWHVCLDALARHLAGETGSGLSEDAWSAVHPGYVAKFGPAAATIGPPGA